MEYQCKKCQQVKSVFEFNRHSRHGPFEPWNLRQCKECARNNYLERRDDPVKVASLQQTSNNWKKAHPEHHAMLAREYRARNKEKTLAQNKLNYAIRSGKIQREPCEVCGTTEKAHAHHKTYLQEDWYNVSWLCFICHKMQHEPNHQ